MARFASIISAVVIAAGLSVSGLHSASYAADKAPPPAAAPAAAPAAPEGAAAKPAAPTAAAAKPAAQPPADLQTFHMAFLTRETNPKPPYAVTDINPTDEGAAGATLGIDDDNTTGKFTHQQFDLKTVTVPLTGDVVAAFKQLVADGQHFIIVDLPAADLLKLADLPEAKDTVIFNVGAPDDKLRNEDCRRNILHVIPNRAMLTDALTQYLLVKKWNKIFLVVGNDPGDQLYADALKRSAKKFGAKIVAEKKWSYSSEEAHRSERSVIPVFTQNVDYDVLVVADEADNFGDDLMFRTWDPKIVAGTQGLMPVAWSPEHEQWGATQLQHRFHKLSGRWMTSVDYSAWIAVRALGEAATRTKSTDFAPLRDYMLGPEFGVGAFKGVPVNFRDWDHQLREPILLAWARTVVSVSPQDQFIHPVSSLDTLGFDKPESTCKFK